MIEMSTYNLHMTRQRREAQAREAQAAARTQAATRAMRRPCYCATVSPCDFCAGLAPLDGSRAAEQRAIQTEEDTP